MILLAAIFYLPGLAALLTLMVWTALGGPPGDRELREVQERDERIENTREREDRLREQCESEYLVDLHLGDPAYDGLRSPRRIRQRQERDRECDDAAR
jgi:hypothetical protein